MTSRIPPLGFCAVCLVAHGDESTALTQINGTSVCGEHVRHVPDPRPEKRTPDAAPVTERYVKERIREALSPRYGQGDPDAAPSLSAEFEKRIREAVSEPYVEESSGVKGDRAWRCTRCGALVANRADHDTVCPSPRDRT